MNLLTFLAKKLFYRFIVFFIILTIVFMIPRLAPGTPIDYLIEDPRVPPEIREQLLEKFGLNKPVFPDQYIQFLYNFFVRFDLGYSFAYQQPVAKLISERIIWSIILLGGALVIAIPTGILLGSLLVSRRGSREYLGVLMLLLLRSFPVFWLGMVLLLIFSYRLELFPSGGATTPGASYSNLGEFVVDVLRHITLPLIALSSVFIVRYTLLMRSSALNTIGEDFVVVALAKGLSRRQILYGYIIKNSMLPVMTIASIDIGFVAGGAVVTETVFSYPGMGRLLYDAVMSRDYPLVLGIFVVISGITLIAVTVAEFIYSIIDPRVRTHET